MVSSVRLSTKDIITTTTAMSYLTPSAMIAARPKRRASFFVKGAAFKKEFLLSAISQGLGWYVAEKDYEVGIPAIIVSDIKKAMSLIAMEFYDNPQKKLKLLAFTGTKGKTTAAYFAYNILSQGHRPAMLSTMNTTLDGKTFFKSALTTP